MSTYTPAAARAVALLVTEQHLMSARDALTLIRRCESANTDPLAEFLATQKTRDVLAAVAAIGNLDLVDLFDPEVGLILDPSTLASCGADGEYLRDHAAVPLVDEADGTLVLATANPLNPQIAHLEASLTPTPSRRVLASFAQVDSQLTRATTTLDSDAFAKAAGLEPVDETTSLEGVIYSEGTINEWLTNQLVAAVAIGASDLHFEMTNGHPSRMLLRFRIDGTLVVQRTPLVGQEMEILSALMLRAGMDVGNKREAQDGAFRMKVSGRYIDTRVNMLPMATGPKIVVRLLDSANTERRLDEMGLDPRAVEIIRRTAQLSQGCLVMAGPTGSGKSTTLYSTLQEVARAELNVSTVEDPVEYRKPWLSQVEVSRLIPFDKALRALLRQDPDVILVGEVRDLETAKTVAHASMTGHLVFTTVHAKTALGIYSRLIEMGLERFNVADTISLLLNQRLIKKVHSCAIERPVTESETAYLATLGATDVTTVKEKVGCVGCSNTGYRGRIPVLELLAPDRTMRRLITKGADTEELLEHIATGEVEYISLIDDTVRHLRQGETTVEELRRVLVVE